MLKVEEEEEPDEEDDDSSEEDSSEDDFEERSRRKRPKKVRELHSLLPTLLPLLTHLVKLDVPYTPPIARRLDSHLSPPPVLPHLRYLASSFELDVDEDVDLDELAQYAALPALKRLKIYDWDEDDFRNCRRSESTLLCSITTLEIRGHSAFKSSVQALIDVCPSILHLELRSLDSHGSPFVDCIPYLPNTLLSLSILAAEYYDFNSELAHLDRLRYLHLGPTFVCEDILDTLCELRSLVHLHLGKGDYSLTGLGSLILRLPYLKMVTLDIDLGVRGEEILGPSSPEFEVEAESARCSIVNMEEDWKLPGEEDNQILDAAELRMFLGVAESKGVIVNDTPYFALEMVADYHIEANNRAVVAAAHEHELWYLEQCRENASDDGICLPDDDLESLEHLEPEQLEIYERNIPGRDWYMLGLAKKEASSDGEW